MLAVATNDGSADNVGKNHIAALDLSVSPSGRLAQVPDNVELKQVAITGELADIFADNIDEIFDSEMDEQKKQELETKLKEGAVVTMPRVQTDPRGQTISGGLLGFAWTNDAPLLFDSATGTLALYFRGRDDQFFVAYYDTFTERARVILFSDEKEAVNCFSTSTSYGKVRMIIEEEAEDEDACQVTIIIQDDEGNDAITETWGKVPRQAREFSSVLNGQATGHSYIGSGKKTKDDELTLSYPGAQRAINKGITLMVGDERIEVKEQIHSGDEQLQFIGSLESNELLPVYYVEYDYERHAACEGIKADLTNGSIIIRAVPEVGNAGMKLSNTEENGVELETKLVCQWTAAAPGSTVAFDGKTQYAHPEEMDSTKLSDFDAAGDRTLEAWAKINLIDERACLIQHQSSDSNYMLALEGHSALVFGGNGYISIPDKPELNFTEAITVEAWIKADKWQAEYWQGVVVGKPAVVVKVPDNVRAQMAGSPL